MKRSLVAVLAGVALLLAGCTGVPGSSSPEVVRTVAIGGGDQSQKLVTPTPGVPPLNLVRSFLAVNADSAGKHASARSFLTTTAGSWTDTTVTVASSVSVAGYANGSVTVNAAVVGTVAANGTYLPALQTGKAAVVQFPFGITSVDGQNRISSLRPGLLLTEDQFLDSYVPRSLYFFDLAHRYLVPDARWTPDSDAIQASEVLMNQLAAGGPSLGLQDAVNNDALPAQSGTRHIDVSGGDPVRIEISGASQLPATNKDRLAAQVAATLNDVDRGRSLEITDGGTPITIPDAGGAQFGLSDFGDTMVASPVPEVYYLRAGQIVDEKRRVVPGPLNYGRYPLQSLAVSRSGAGGNLSVAGVSTIAGRAELVMGTQSDGLRRSTVVGVTSRPAFAPGRVEAWVGAGSRIYRSVLAGTRITSATVPLQLPVPGQTVVALRLSPEGSRIAVVLRDPVGHRSLYTGAVVRNASTNQVRVNSLVQISPSNVTVTDLAWIEGERLNAIGYDSGSPDDAHVYRTGADGSNWMEYGLGELPGPPATLAGAPGQPAWAAAGTPPRTYTCSGAAWRGPTRDRSPRPRSGTRRPTSSERLAGAITPRRPSTGLFRNPLLVHRAPSCPTGKPLPGHAGPVPPALLTAVVDLVLPRRCVGCGAGGTALCRRCRPDAPRAVADEPVPGLPVLAGAAYGGAVRRAVLAFKERGRRDLVGPLGLVLGRTVSALLVGLPREATVLVTVPSSRIAAAARGGDHVLRLARRAAVVSGVRVAPGVLQLGRTVQDSAGLGRLAREQNLHGALRARAPTGGRAVPQRAIVVDDIVTTGATLREAVRALRSAGWNVAGAAVVAATARQHDDIDVDEVDVSPR